MGPMAGRTLSLATPGTNYLKETLHAQQELLQKLYSELDMERESSATAADEALSMILRLQGEKAAVGMEASQYKRIAEEKICHAQETLETFQEVIYQKEMQIASLEFQVQAYRFKLLSMGCDDLGTCEIQYPDNMLSRKNAEESSSRSSLRRNSSLPPPPNNGALSRRASTEGTKSSTPSPHPWQESKGEDPYIRREQDSYWEEIKKLDERLKELDDLKGSSTFPSSEDTNDVSLTSASPMLHPFPENTPAKSDCLESPEIAVSVQACEDSACSTSVQDIFEVPICPLIDQDGNSDKESHNLTFESENRNGKLDSVWSKICKSIVKEKNDWEKKPLLSPDSDPPSLTKTDDAKEIIDWEKKPLFSPSSSNESVKPKECKIDKPLLFKQPAFGVADLEFQQFNRRLKQLEDQRFVTRGQEINADKAEEELRVLWEIRDKIDSMQAEIARWRTKKPLPPDSRSPGCLKEVILCFWP
ncbi:uncharacterized protein LOC110715775 [Chenopodium quinoa]|uniref:uncharacterized protein LOC110715775 n=1 Tax=Chenopodium quinoa TaxID=63459 RepID=UPI000B799F0A|nr:uncharacterized protein LOC110715775 [Chenopodium quinoa]